MKLLIFIHLSWRQFLTCWALAEIDPLHPEVPRLVLHKLELEEALKGLWL